MTVRLAPLAILALLALAAFPPTHAKGPSALEAYYDDGPGGAWLVVNVTGAPAGSVLAVAHPEQGRLVLDREVPLDTASASVRMRDIPSRGPFEAQLLASALPREANGVPDGSVLNTSASPALLAYLDVPRDPRPQGDPPLVYAPTVVAPQVPDAQPNPQGSWLNPRILVTSQGYVVVGWTDNGALKVALSFDGGRSYESPRIVGNATGLLSWSMAQVNDQRVEIAWQPRDGASTTWELAGVELVPGGKASHTATVSTMYTAQSPGGAQAVAMLPDGRGAIVAYPNGASFVTLEVSANGTWHGLGYAPLPTSTINQLRIATDGAAVDVLANVFGPNGTTRGWMRYHSGDGGYTFGDGVLVDPGSELATTFDGSAFLAVRSVYGGNLEAGRDTGTGMAWATITAVNGVGVNQGIGARGDDACAVFLSDESFQQWHTVRCSHDGGRTWPVWFNVARRENEPYPDPLAMDGMGSPFVAMFPDGRPIYLIANGTDLSTNALFDPRPDEAGVVTQVIVHDTGPRPPSPPRLHLFVTTSAMVPGGNDTLFVGIEGTSETPSWSLDGLPAGVSGNVSAASASVQQGLGLGWAIQLRAAPDAPPGFANATVRASFPSGAAANATFSVNVQDPRALGLVLRPGHVVLAPGQEITLDVLLPRPINEGGLQIEDHPAWLAMESATEGSASSTRTTLTVRARPDAPAGNTTTVIAFRTSDAGWESPLEVEILLARPPAIETGDGRSPAPAEAPPLAPLLVGGAAVATVGAGAIAFSRTDAGRLGLAAATLPLYTRLAKGDVLQNEVRAGVHQHVLANPGARFNEMRRDLDLSNGALAFHLRVLQREGYVTAHKDWTQRRYYATGRIPERATAGVADAVTGLLRASPGLALSEIARRLGVSRQLAAYHLRKLERERRVRRVDEGRAPSWYVAEE